MLRQINAATIYIKTKKHYVASSTLTTLTVSGDAGQCHTCIPVYNDVLIKQQSQQVLENCANVEQCEFVLVT